MSLLLTVLPNAVAFAQEQRRPIIVSPLIGDTLDLVERDHYHLFPTLNEFQWAVFYLNPDSMLAVKVTFSDGMQRDSIVKRYVTLAALQDHIDRTEKQIEDAARDGVSLILNLKDGKEIHGELLSVRDSALVISSLEAGNQRDTVSSDSVIIILSVHQIQKLFVKGKSKVVLGMGLGLLIGAGLGVGVGYASGDDPPPPPCQQFICFYPTPLTAGQKAARYGVGLGLSGLAIGYLIGNASSVSDQTILVPGTEEISALKQRARFRAGEPAFLRKIK